MVSRGSVTRGGTMASDPEDDVCICGDPDCIGVCQDG